MLEREVMEPRRAERAEAERARVSARASTGLRYDYASELFSVRRKDFWPLFHARTVLEKLIPTLCHESDGLIFQVNSSLWQCWWMIKMLSIDVLTSPTCMHFMAVLRALLQASGL